MQLITERSSRTYHAPFSSFSPLPLLLRSSSYSSFLLIRFSTRRWNVVSLSACKSTLPFSFFLSFFSFPLRKITDDWPFLRRFCHSRSNLWKRKSIGNCERERPIELIASEESLSMKVTVTLRAPYSLHPFHSISDTFSLSSSRGGSKTCYDKNSARRFSENFSNISPSISVISEGGGKSLQHPFRFVQITFSIRWIVKLKGILNYALIYFSLFFSFTRSSNVSFTSFHRRFSVIQIPLTFQSRSNFNAISSQIKPPFLAYLKTE